jgi:hypothetical protein
MASISFLAILIAVSNAGLKCSFLILENGASLKESKSGLSAMFIMNGFKI